MDKSSSLIFLTLVFIILFIIVFFPQFSKTETQNLSENASDLYYTPINTMVNWHISGAFLNDGNIETPDIQVDTNLFLQKMREYILNMKLTSPTTDTIKRILLAHLDKASLILNDNDSDNDNLICSSIIPEFISDIELYEKIRFLSSGHANKMYMQIKVLEDSFC